jgi:hypothetical protein
MPKQSSAAPKEVDTGYRYQRIKASALAIEKDIPWD